MGCCVQRGKITDYNLDTCQLTLSSIPTYENILQVYETLELPLVITDDRISMHKKE